MKVCVITPYDSANYGAFLQAYATKLFLESKGHDVYFLRWRDENEKKKEFFNRPKAFKAKVRYYQRYSYLKRKYEIFTKCNNVFNTINSGEIQKCDAVIIGSDEVWNITVPKFQKDCFYGININDKILKLAYAPSVSNSSIEDFKCFPRQIEGMKKISLIGARDEETKKIYDCVTGSDVDLVCDPTLLLTEKEWSFSDAKIDLDKYILVYSYDIPKTHRKMLKEIAKKRGCKLVAVGLYASWCDLNICCTPFEFCSYIRQAEAVYTTTFHGSIFTLLNHKKCLIRATSKKLNDLLERFDVMSMKEPEQINADEMERLLFMERDYSLFETKLCSIREESRKLYIDSLEHTS